MEEQALEYLKQLLDKATQKGAFSMNEVANAIACIEKLNNLINSKKAE